MLYKVTQIFVASALYIWALAQNTSYLFLHFQILLHPILKYSVFGLLPFKGKVKVYDGFIEKHTNCMR